MSEQPDKKVVMITGAGGNLGAAVARKFQETGARLVLIEHGSGKLEKLFPDLAADDNHRFFENIDVSDPAAMAELVDKIKKQFGRIDTLVNTVGGYQAGWPLHETPLSVWQHMISLNATSVFVTCQSVIPTMIAQKKGSIINISGGAGLKGTSKNSAYSAAKSAVIRLTESMAAELKADGIRVNCILPGTIDTPENRAAMPKADFSHWVAPQSLADVIVFISSDAASRINGAAIPVTG